MELKGKPIDILTIKKDFIHNLHRYSADFSSLTLQFKKPAGTSRGVLTEKPSWIIELKDNEQKISGLGECSIIPHLSIDNEAKIALALLRVCSALGKTGNLDEIFKELDGLPAFYFAAETALADLNGGGKRKLFDNAFSRGEKGIPINGLIWMAEKEDMYRQAVEKIESGFTCLKFKIGAIDFYDELALLEKIRSNFDKNIEIRLDANGAFEPSKALNRIRAFSQFNIHSVEQPIKQGNWKTMAKICQESQIPIALDEELIGIFGANKKRLLLKSIQPQYIILKPSLLGGFAQSDEWISIAEENNIGWWATSALESNIGLNAIAQWVADKNPIMPQGLGTGGLYVENYPINLEIKMGELWFNN